MRTLALAIVATALAASGPAAAAGLGSLFSCDAQGSANTTGAVVGGLVGGLVGSQVSKKDRAIGAVIGAGLGAAIGNSIGCKMDKKGQQDARLAFERALDTGRPQNWSDAQSGASGRIEVLGPAGSSSYYAGGQSSYTGRWRFAPGVAAATRTNSQGGAYVSDSRINMRAAPSAQAAIVDRLQAGEQVEVAGAVAGGGWLAVVEDGVIQGYVARSVVRPADAGGSGGEGCQLVQQTITEPGRAPQRERYTACRDGRGSWNLNAA